MKTQFLGGNLLDYNLHITIMAMEEEKRIELTSNTGGRGLTMYVPEYDDQAYRICLLGATTETLAEFFGVCPTTLKKWMKKYPGFGESVRKGKLIADATVAANLYKRANGYNYQQVVLEPVQESGTQAASEKVTSTVGTFLPEDISEAAKLINEGLRIARITTREVMPSVRAQIFWLKNRQPKLWSDKQEINHKTDSEKMSRITIFELPNDGRND